MITRKEMTRMLLKEGLLSCLEHHSFESVTVTLLCKASGITRVIGQKVCVTNPNKLENL